MKEKRQAGRPPAAVNDKGQPEQTSKWPKLAIGIRPSSKAILDGIAALENKPAWQVVEAALLGYFAKMPAADRALVESLAARRARR